LRKTITKIWWWIDTTVRNQKKDNDKYKEYNKIIKYYY
jgi:hypothetical protein